MSDATDYLWNVLNTTRALKADMQVHELCMYIVCSAAYMIYHGRDSGILNLEYLRERGTILWGNVGKRNDWKDQKRISQNYVSAEIQHEIGHSVGIHMVRGLYFKILLLRYDRIQTFYRPEVHQFRVFKQKPNS